MRWSEDCVQSRTRAVAACALAAIVLAACTGGGSEAIGRVLSVDGDLRAITGFTIVTRDGSRLSFVAAPEADRLEFPLVHLRDHILSGQPVAVLYEVRDGVAVAVRIDDT